MEHEDVGETNCNLSTWHSQQSIGVGTGGLGNQRTSGDHPIYGVGEIGQNTKKMVEESCCHSDSSEESPVNADEKDSQ